MKKWALSPCFQTVNEEFCLKNCWKKYVFMSNSILFNVACSPLAFLSKGNLCTSIQFSVSFIILDTEKTNIDWKILILNMFKTWSFFDKKLRHSVTKNVTALRSFFAFSISTKKGVRKTFYQQKAHLILYNSDWKLSCFEKYLCGKSQLHQRHRKKRVLLCHSVTRW
jgi:hypothetical protein